jgi:hypothetical protein
MVTGTSSRQGRFGGSPRWVLFGSLLLALVFADGAAAAVKPVVVRDLADDGARGWLARQDDTGQFEDGVLGKPGPDYGTIATGYGLIRTGMRLRNRSMVDAGMRSVSLMARRHELYPQGVLNPWGLALAYDYAQRHLAGEPRYAREIRSWESYLKQFRPVKLLRNRSEDHYDNHWLIEAVAVLEALRGTDFTSSDPKAWLRDRPHAARVAYRVLARTAPRIARRSLGGDGSSILSDPGRNPPAYHALSAALLAQAVGLADDPKGKIARTLRSLVEASWRFAAPDGDLALWGRGQEHVWALAATAYAARVASKQRDLPAGDRARYRELEARAIDRLRDAYLRSDGTFDFVPAQASLKPDLKGIDPYTREVSENGLALVFLNLLNDELAGERSDGGGKASIGADADGGFVASAGQASFATVRRGGVWFAVLKSPGRGDTRNDFGLAGLKSLRCRKGEESWEDLIPARPLTRKVRSAGPLLVQGDRRGIPIGAGLRVNRNGTVVVRGSFRSIGSRKRRLRRGVTFRFKPVADGVELSFPAKTGDVYELRHYFTGRSLGRLAKGARQFSDGRTVLGLSHPAGLPRLERGYYSASHRNFSAVVMRITVPRAAQVRITIARPHRTRGSRSC